MARPKLGDTDTERMQLKITTAEITAIDDWRFENRVPSRSEAVRRLVQIGLAFERIADGLEYDAQNLLEKLDGLTNKLEISWRRDNGSGMEVDQNVLGSLIGTILSASTMMERLSTVSEPAKQMRSSISIAELIEKTKELAKKTEEDAKK